MQIDVKLPKKSLLWAQRMLLLNYYYNDNIFLTSGTEVLVNVNSLPFNKRGLPRTSNNVEMELQAKKKKKIWGSVQQIILVTGLMFATGAKYLGVRNINKQNVGSVHCMMLYLYFFLCLPVLVCASLQDILFQEVRISHVKTLKYNSQSRHSTEKLSINIFNTEETLKYNSKNKKINLLHRLS